MSNPSKHATLLFLMSGDEILLAMKKRGFGAGWWNGVGGKPEPSESIEQTAVRECQEEIGVTPVSFKQVATLDFYFAEDKADWNQRVFVYLCDEWQGEPVESEEMKPDWFNIADIPYDTMWEDDKYWLPEVLAGRHIKGEFSFDANDNLSEHSIRALN